MSIDDALSVATARRKLPPPAVCREIRETAGVSQRAIAAEIGVDVAQVSRWENGLRRPRGRNAIAYAAVLRQLVEAIRP